MPPEGRYSTPEREAPPVLVTLVKDIVKTQTVTCGEVDMILGSTDYSRLNVAICPNIRGFRERSASG